MSKRRYSEQFTVDEVLEKIFESDDDASVDFERDDGYSHADPNPGSDDEIGAEEEDVFSSDDEYDDNDGISCLPSSQESVKFEIRNSDSQELIETVIGHDEGEPNWTGYVSIPREKFVFTGQPGISDDVLDCENPLDFFKLIITDELVDLIVNYTNIYADQMILKAQPLSSRSRLKKWTPVTKDEIYLYICLILYRGVVWKPTYESYYARDDVFTTPLVSKILPYDRFFLIDRFIHFCDNENISLKDFKIAKIKEVFDYVEEKFSMLYTPERDICIDESLMLWKGRLSWKQYIRTKRSRFGIKSFSLCESSSGYVWSSCLYSGKELTEKLSLKYSDKYHYVATNVVLYLMKNLLGKGYCLYLDNWYTSVELVRCLTANQTDVIGTLRMNRRGLPKELSSIKLNNGECVNAYDQHGIMVTRWKDSRDVHLISTCVDGNTWVKVKRAGKEKDIPLVVQTYNLNMGGVDHADQMCSSYDCGRKRVKKWYKKSFMHLLNEVVFNCFVLY